MLLRTLGGLELVGGTLRRPKPLLLLCYVSLEGAKDRRHLAELFYRGTRKPAAGLRVALKHIRDEGALLETEETSVRARLASDAADLLAASEGRDHAGVVDLYGGAFLERVLLDWNVELEDWVYTTREYLADRAREAHLHLAEAKGRRGDLVGAAALVERAYHLAGAAPADPELLARIHPLLVAAAHPLARGLEQEAASYGLTLGRAPAAPLWPPAERATPHNLPTEASSFVGREAELRRVAALLADDAVRVLTILGLGGMGKTRLALQAAREALGEARFADGVFAVLLDTVTEQRRALSRIAEVLGATLAPGEATAEGLAELIGNKRLLLVLDNLEQLTPQADVLSVLAARCPGLKLLATSREQLGLEEEWVLELGGLALPDDTAGAASGLGADEDGGALGLFMQRARRARLDFVPNDADREAAVQICRLVEGAPLGIELAAAWVKIMPPAAIALGVARSLDILTSHARHARERHRSIRVSFEASWRNLSGAERELLARLSVFQASFSREAATEVAGASIPLLLSLAQKSMVNAGADGRYSVHPLLRRYALEKLETGPGAAPVRRAHAAYYRRYALTRGPDLEGPDSSRCLGQLNQDFDNLDAAFDWATVHGDAALLADLFWPIRIFWYFKRDLSRALERFDHLLARPELQLQGLAQLKLKLGAVAVLKEAGQLASARVLAEDCERLASALEQSELRLFALSSLGDLALLLCDYASAEAHYRAALTLARGHPDPRMPLGLERSSVQLAYLRGQFGEAAARLEGLLEVSKREGHVWQLGYVLEALANSYRDGGRYAEALPLYEEALALFKTLGQHSHSAVVLMQLGVLRLYRGELDEAETALTQALGLHTRRRAALDRALCQVHLADLATLKGDFEGARTLLREGLKTLRQLSARAELLHVLDVCAQLLALGCRPEVAGRLAGAGETLRARWQVSRSSYQQARMAGRFDLERLGAQPKGASLEAALEVALEALSG